MGLRDRLRQRERPHSVYPIRVDDTTEAEKRVREAREAHNRAVLRHGEESPEAAVAKTALEEATEGFDACFEHVCLVAMRSEDYEALVAQHPPRDGEKDDEKLGYNTATFPPALLAECAQGDATADDWNEFLASCSYGEREEILIVVQALNVRGPASSVPKG